VDCFLLAAASRCWLDGVKVDFMLVEVRVDQVYLPSGIEQRKIEQDQKFRQRENRNHRENEVHHRQVVRAELEPAGQDFAVGTILHWEQRMHRLITKQESYMLSQSRVNVVGRRLAQIQLLLEAAHRQPILSQKAQVKHCITMLLCLLVRNRSFNQVEYFLALSDSHIALAEKVRDHEWCNQECSVISEDLECDHTY